MQSGSRFVLMLMLSLTICSTTAFGRKWKDASGKHTVEAVLVEVKDGTAALRRSDGKVVAVPIEKLSPEDQKYVYGMLSKCRLTMDKNTLIVTPNLSLPELGDNERLGLYVFVATENAIMNERRVRSVRAGTIHILTPTGVPVNASLPLYESPVSGGTMYYILDHKGEVILDGAEVKMDIGDREKGTSVYAALGVYNSKISSYRFLRFASPVAVTKVRERNKVRASSVKESDPTMPEGGRVDFSLPGSR